MGQLGNRMHRRQLHLFVDRRRADVQRAAEDEREAKYVVDLVRVVGAAGTDDGVIADLLRQRRQDFRLRVGQGEDLAAVPPRYRSSYFSHIFGGGYAAGYYAYLWTQMLADDGYQWFVEQGGLTRENGQRFREAILSRGNSTDLAELYRQWRGHDPQIEPMLKNRGLSA